MRTIEQEVAQLAFDVGCDEAVLERSGGDGEDFAVRDTLEELVDAMNAIAASGVATGPARAMKRLLRTSS